MYFLNLLKWARFILLKKKPNQNQTGALELEFETHVSQAIFGKNWWMQLELSE